MKNLYIKQDEISGVYLISERSQTDRRVASVYKLSDARLFASAPEMLNFLKENKQSLINFFEGLEGPFSDKKRHLLDLIKYAESGENK